MKIEYHNLYTHFILITQDRVPSIPEKNRERIEKYITGIVNNNQSKLYSIYVNPEHAHILVSRSPKLSEEVLATIIAESSLKFINDNKLSHAHLDGSSRLPLFLFQNQMWIRFTNTYSINLNITER